MAPPGAPWGGTRGANRPQLAPKALLEAILPEISLKTWKSSKTFVIYEEKVPPPCPQEGGPRGPNRAQLAPKSLLEAVLTEISLKT